MVSSPVNAATWWIVSTKPNRSSNTAATTPPCDAPAPPRGRRAACTPRRPRRPRDGRRGRRPTCSPRRRSAGPGGLDPLTVIGRRLHDPVLHVPAGSRTRRSLVRAAPPSPRWPRPPSPAAPRGCCARRCVAQIADRPSGVATGGQLACRRLLTRAGRRFAHRSIMAQRPRRSGLRCRRRPRSLHRRGGSRLGGAGGRRLRRSRRSRRGAARPAGMTTTSPGWMTWSIPSAQLFAAINASIDTQYFLAMRNSESPPATVYSCSPAVVVPGAVLAPAAVVAVLSAGSGRRRRCRRARRPRDRGAGAHRGRRARCAGRRLVASTRTQPAAPSSSRPTPAQRNPAATGRGVPLHLVHCRT